MNIDLMRLIDYWLGVPLCFLLSALDAIGRMTGLGRKPAGKGQRKIAFVKLSEMGAIILAYPLLTAAKKEIPEEKIFFVTFKKNKSVFDLFPGLIPRENILTIRDGRLPGFVTDTLKVIRRLRKEKIDIVFDLEFFSRFTAILSYLSCAGKRAGFYRYNYEGLYRGSLFTHRLQYNPLLHVSRSYLSLWQAAGDEQKRTPELDPGDAGNEIVLPRIKPDSRQTKEAVDILRAAGIKDGSRVFFVNPGEGTLALREWPLENFICLAKKILEDEKNSVVIIGTQDAAGKAAVLAREVGNSRCVNLIGKTQVCVLPALFSISEALIANDCGLAHIASLSPIKKFIIFGPESPAVFGPLGDNNFTIYSGPACSPCLSGLNHRKSSCRDSKCLKAVNCEDVYGLINKTINGLRQ